jgi:hypothetical protein
MGIHTARLMEERLAERMAAGQSGEQNSR